MTIKAWGPLFALLSLFAISGVGLFLQHSQPHDYRQPGKTEDRNRPSSESGTAIGTEQHSEKGEQERPWYKELFDKPTDWLLAIFTGFLVLYTRRLNQATIGLVQAAAEQSRDMKESITLSRETAKRQLRAYVYIDGGQFDYSATHNAFRGHLVLKNFGQTPAYDSQVDASVRIFDANAPIFDFTKLNTKRSAKTTIGPTAENNIERTVKAASGDLDAVIRREKRIFMWGTATYRDAFDEHQTFEFRCVSHLLRNGANTWTMDPYPEGQSD